MRDRHACRRLTALFSCYQGFWLNALVGPTRAMLQGQTPPKMLRALRAQLVMLSDVYLKRVAVAA